MQHIKTPLMLMLALTLAFSQSHAQKKNKNQDTEPRKAPEMPMENGQIVYAGVQKTSGKQAVLYKKAKDWFNGFYKNVTQVIKEDDEDKGSITGQSRFKINNYDEKTGTKSDAGLVQYTIVVTCKDGEYSYRSYTINWKTQSFYGIETWLDTEGQYYTVRFIDYLEQTDEYLKNLEESLKSAMGQ